jgi:hypothetical protein
MSIEARVNKAIVQQLECFYQEIRERPRGRYPEIDRRAWTTLNLILGGVRGVPLQSVADAVGVNVEPLQVGKKRRSKWLEYNGDPALAAPYLEAVSLVNHGGSLMNGFNS